MQELIQSLTNRKEILLLDNEQQQFSINVATTAINDNNLALKRIKEIETQLNYGYEPDEILTTEEKKIYFPEERSMLFDNNLPLNHWLDWFYEEIPYIKDKYLIFIDSTGKTYYPEELSNPIVQVNHKKQTIFVFNGLNSINITIPNLNIYELLSI